MKLICLHVTVYIFRGMGIFVCVYYINAYVNEYIVACNEWNSVACNTTRRRLFCFMCVN